MKISFSFILLFFTVNYVLAQSTGVISADINARITGENIIRTESATHPYRGPEVCSDTVIYPFAKRSSNRGIFLNNVTSATDMCIWYEVPQQMTIYGFEFFAYQSDPNISSPINVNCAIYDATSGKLPSGTPIRTTIVSVPQSTNTSLSAIRKTAVFSPPVLVNGPFVLAVENNSAINITISTSNWDNGDGDLEYNSGGKIGGLWRNGNNITVGSVLFDADVYIHPYVKYTVNTEFAMDKHCIVDLDSVRFFNLCSPIFNSHMYNVTAFNDTAHSGIKSFEWNFGNGGGIENVFEKVQHYIQKKKYVISLDTKLDTWGGQCLGNYKDSIDREPVAGFEYLGNNHDIQLVNTSIGLDNVTWILDPTTFSNLKNPLHHFFTEGVYDVTLIIKNACGIDSITKPVAIYPVGINDPQNIQVNIWPNPAHSEINVELPLTESGFLINLMDISGKTWVTTQSKMGESSVKIGLSQLPKGLYILEINDGTRKTLKKISVF